MHYNFGTAVMVDPDYTVWVQAIVTEVVKLDAYLVAYCRSKLMPVADALLQYSHIAYHALLAYNTHSTYVRACTYSWDPRMHKNLIFFKVRRNTQIYIVGYLLSMEMTQCYMLVALMCATGLLAL